MNKPKAVYLLPEDMKGMIYGPAEVAAIDQLTNIEPRALNINELADAALLAEAELVFSGWGCPSFDEELVGRMPKLQAIFYGAGSVRGMATPALWERNIRLTSAAFANAKPVVEFTFAQIILSLKKTHQQAVHVQTTQQFQRLDGICGAYRGSRVGVISLGAIGRMICERINTLDVEVLAFDPFVSAGSMNEINIRKAELLEIFETCDVISVHAPMIPATIGMIQEEHFRAMKDGATFINTSRGAIIDEPAMVRVLQERPEIVALLDVTSPEPPIVGSPLYTLPNVQLTPHIAGSRGYECHRMGQLAIEECRRFLDGKVALYPVNADNFDRLA
jgi:phosphoglycerate dehydrogenase-like enzyme|tara:strand:- start:5199 stop:6197 length:999 start_codon:yes stop_codon:yes gene_type:complete